ncbi:MAG TPA: RNA methyltransferase [Chloroflexia bacterium]|nr:RNA methyltransferase [Chloroflexia bacterium]
MPFKGNYNKSGGPQKQRPSGDHRAHQGQKPNQEQQRPAQNRPQRKPQPQENLPEEKIPGLLTSPDNDKVRFIHNLLSKKDRYVARHFLAEGVRLVDEALNSPKPSLYTIYDPEALGKTEAGQRLLIRLYDMVEQKKGVFPATARILEFMSDTVTPQGVVAAVPFLDWQAEQLAAARLHIVLDELQDPGNLGTIMRSAGGAGDTAVWLTEGSVDFYSPKVVRAGMGAHFRVPSAYGLAWPDLLERLKEAGVEQIFLAESEGSAGPVGESLPAMSYYEVDWTKPSAVIIGNEAHGPGPEARRAATHLLTIPMPGGAESLNASVAASLIIFEALRHRLQK